MRRSPPSIRQRVTSQEMTPSVIEHRGDSEVAVGSTDVCVTTEDEGRCKQDRDRDESAAGAHDGGERMEAMPGAGIAVDGRVGGGHSPAACASRGSRAGRAAEPRRPRRAPGCARRSLLQRCAFGRWRVRTSARSGPRSRRRTACARTGSPTAAGRGRPGGRADRLRARSRPSCSPAAGWRDPRSGLRSRPRQARSRRPSDSTPVRSAGNRQRQPRPLPQPSRPAASAAGAATGGASARRARSLRSVHRSSPAEYDSGSRVPSSHVAGGLSRSHDGRKPGGNRARRLISLGVVRGPR